LAAVAGVESVDVQLGESRASLVVENATSDEALMAAVEAAGFGASPT
jgi:copper chaperone CopZ